MTAADVDQTGEAKQVNGVAESKGVEAGRKESGVSKKSVRRGLPRRYMVAILAFLGFWNVYALRVNLSVAIVAMTTPYNVTVERDGVLVQEVRQDFDWDLPTKGLLLSSFFYGYIFTQLLGGWLATRIGGGARLFCAGIGVTAVLTLITPPVAYASLPGLFIIRIVEGLFEGVTFPSIHAVWSHWAPPLERSRLATIAFSGSFVGTVVSLPVSSLLADTLGWESIFYIFGVIAAIWCTAWWIIVKEKPELDKNISEEELDYIKTSLGPQSSGARPPWRQIVMSMPVWAIVVSHFCENWGFYTLLTQLPTFVKDTLGFDLGKAGFLSALPYLAMAIVLQISGQLADYMRSLHVSAGGKFESVIFSTTGVRKVFNCTAFLCQTVFMLLAAHIPSAAGAVTCLTLAVGLGGFAWSGFSVNHLDIAPQYAGVLMGFGNTFATLPGIISPTLTGYIVRDGDPSQWKNVFYIAGGLYLMGAVFYGIFASGVMQPWAKEVNSSNGNSKGNNGRRDTPAEHQCYSNEVVVDERL
ncbi:sialin-like [Ischnura elegans]|uniref:sialin-like n=1 Tax=Ischnura elegans TaxID=197161 RepID=UPI001ED87827|nr:sialin-like [Ischnura elegans]